MSFRVLVILIVVTSISACDYYIVNNYKERIGYIDPSTAIVDDDFELCFKEVAFPDYFNRKPVEYIHGKDSLKLYFAQHYDNQGITNESGYITLRFMVNCKGAIGSFEIFQTGNDYHEKKFNSQLTSHLLELTKQLKEWQPFSRGDSTFDCFTHLTFKIENGALVEILP